MAIRNPNRKDNVSIHFFVDNEKSMSMKSKLFDEEVEQKELLTTAVDAYLNGNAKKLTKSGKVIRISCEIEELDF